MAENSTEYKYTVDVRSIPQKPKGLIKIVPTRIRARFGSTHEAFGDAYMGEEQARGKVSPIVDNFRVMHGDPKKIYFGKVVTEEERQDRHAR